MYKTYSVKICIRKCSIFSSFVYRYSQLFNLVSSCHAADGPFINEFVPNTGLFEMIVGVLTTCHTQYTSDSSICVFFYLIEQHSKLLLHTLQVLYMRTVCDSTDINTIIQFAPRVSGDSFNGVSDSYLQFRDTCGMRRNINLILDVTP